MKKFMSLVVLSSSIFICNVLNCDEPKTTEVSNVQETMLFLLEYKSRLNDTQITSDTNLSVTPGQTVFEDYLSAAKNINGLIYDDLMEKLSQLPKEQSDTFLTRYATQIAKLKGIAEKE